MTDFEQLGELLKSKKLSLACAESLTGGLFAERLTEISGISACFRGGVVVYCNEAKINVLGVDESIIREHTELSAECAEAMARQAAKLFRADIGVSFTGVAGPTGGTAACPVGTVYSCVYFGVKILPLHNVFDGSREAVREAAANAVCAALLQIIS